MGAGTTPDEPPRPVGDQGPFAERRGPGPPPAGAEATPAPAADPAVKPASPGARLGPGGDVRIRPTRTSTVWTMVAVGVLLLALILVFILQNGDRILVKLWLWDVTLPLGVALLFAVVLGALLMLAIGAARIMQLRLAARQLKNDRISARAAARWRGRGRSGS
jgi:uncharacterized integral membrane protein